MVPFIIGGLALVFGYAYITRPQSGTTSENSGSNPNTPGRLQYPFQPTIPPRVDNSNQPWFNNNRVAVLAQNIPGAPGKDISTLLQAKDASSIATSVSSIWSDLGATSWFSNDEASNNSEDDYSSDDSED